VARGLWMLRIAVRIRFSDLIGQGGNADDATVRTRGNAGIVKCKLLCARGLWCMCTHMHTHTNEHPSHRRAMHVATTVKLLPGDTKVLREKIHLGRIDEPRSAKAYDFGNSLAVFQSFFGQSPCLIACKTHGNLSIYSLELWALKTLRPARLIKINGRACNYCRYYAIKYGGERFFEIWFYFLEQRNIRIFKFEDVI